MKNFAKLMKYGKDEKTLEEIKRDLIDLDNEIGKRKQSVFCNKEGRYFNFHKMGQRKTVGLRKLLVKKRKLVKNFVSQRRRITEGLARKN